MEGKEANSTSDSTQVISVGNCHSVPLGTPRRWQRLCFRVVPSEEWESWGIYPPPPLSSWLMAAPEHTNSWVLSSCCICRQMCQEAFSRMLSANGCGWGTNSICSTYRQKSAYKQGGQKSSVMQFQVRPVNQEILKFTMVLFNSKVSMWYMCDMTSLLPALPSEVLE